MAVWSVQAFFVLTVSVGGVCGQYYGMLYSNLVANSPSPVIPKVNVTTPVNVKFGLRLQRVVSLNPASLEAEFDVWLSYKWTNHLLGWLPLAYGDIQSLSVPSKTFWKPDVVLYDSPMDTKTPEVNAVVKSSGEMILVQPARVHTFCDSGTGGSIVCEVKLGSWTHSERDLDLQLDPNIGSDVSELKENSRWRLSGHNKERTEIQELCCPENYPVIIYKFTFVGNN